MLVLHDEVDGVATLAAAEALEYPLGGGNSEGGRFLIMERTETQQVDPSSLQRNELGNDVGYLCSVEDPFYGGVVNHGRINVLKKVLVMNTGRKPLMVRRARQVGKTYSIEKFARENYSYLLKVDLSRTETSIQSLRASGLNR